MIKRNYNNKYKKRSKKNPFYQRQLNKIIIVLSILIIILIIKIFTNETTNNFIEIIKNNIYYEFSWKDDGKRVSEYIRKFMGNTIESIETFNMERKR